MSLKEKVVYICHPFAGNPKGNKQKVFKIVDQIIEENLKLWEDYVNDSLSENTASMDFLVTPLSVFHAFPESMEESEKVSRELVMFYCKSLLKKCDEIWVYSSDGITEGMKEEIELASDLGIKIVIKSL